MTPYTPEEIALARECAGAVMKNRGLKRGNGWEYAIALEAAQIAIRATTERAAKLAEPCDFDNGWGAYIANELRANEHLKDRPDAG